MNEEDIQRIKEKATKTLGRKVERSIKWIEEYADKLDRERWEHDYNRDYSDVYNPKDALITFDALIKAAKDYLDNSETFTLPFEFTSQDFDEEFWVHFTNVTGRALNKCEAESFFRCTC